MRRLDRRHGTTMRGLMTFHQVKALGVAAALLLAALALFAGGGRGLVAAETAVSPQQAEAAALFKRIYAKPDDLDALFRYAEVSAGLGDDEAAIGALERILYFKPDLPRVRLYLALVRSLPYRISEGMARSLEARRPGTHVPCNASQYSALRANPGACTG
jgi:hypothetical protein